MKTKSSLIPVKRILNQINSCKDTDDINKCKNLIDNYVESAKKYQVINHKDLKDRLNEELFKRQEELFLVKIFKI